MLDLPVLNDSNIEDFVKNSKLPVFIDMWGDWCPPCKKVGPTIKELAEQYKDKMIFTKLNTDNNPKTVDQYHVMSIPMFLILDNKKNILEKFNGAIPKKKFEEKIISSLSKTVIFFLII